MLICILKAGYTVQFAGNSCDIKKGEDGHIVGRKPIVHWQSRTRFRQNPCQHSHAQSQAGFSYPSIRALLIFKPVLSPDRGVHVIDNFPL